MLAGRSLRKIDYWLVAALVITAWGTLLRLDAYTGRYGTLNHPSWARIATQDVAPLARHIRPADVRWTHVDAPYVGSDPINYLRFAREMTAFYQPHVREPIFLTAVRVSLALLDNQDAAVSLASIAGSVLLIFGAYLLGAEIASPLGGLIAALVMALDYDVIRWAPDGWRDDMFAATVAFAAWALIRFHRRPSFANGLIAGVTCGIACLTRITALSFVLPALAWIALAGNGAATRARREYAGVAIALAAAIVAPFLISCAIGTGDPLFAIDYHTVYYRAAEGMPVAHPMGVGEYLHAKLAAHPVGTLDTAATGEFVRPFVTKWTGLDRWSPRIAVVLRTLALAGLLALPFSREGRLLLVILLGALLPYAFTWNVGDGGEWRFTMHAYALYVAAAVTIVRIPEQLRSRAGVLVALRRAAMMSAAAAVAIFAYFALPWFVVREAIVQRESVSIETGPRDNCFYRRGWSHPHSAGLATVRVATSPRASVLFPLPGRGIYDVTLRVDPVAPDAGQSMTVLFNDQVVLRTALSWDPQRVGAYRIRLPEDWITAGTNQLTFIPSPMVPAAAADPRFAWLPPSEPIGLRLWYVRVVPADD
jgi:hypothetical protein